MGPAPGPESTTTTTSRQSYNDMISDIEAMAEDLEAAALALLNSKLLTWRAQFKDSSTSKDSLSSKDSSSSEDSLRYNQTVGEENQTLGEENQTIGEVIQAFGEATQTIGEVTLEGPTGITIVKMLMPADFPGFSVDPSIPGSGLVIKISDLSDISDITQDVEAEIEVPRIAYNKLEQMGSDPIMFITVMNASSYGSYTWDDPKDRKPVANMLMSISFMVANRYVSMQDLDPPITFTMPWAENSTQCSYWDTEVLMWSFNGVWNDGDGSDYLRCAARHLTLFAALEEVVFGGGETPITPSPTSAPVISRAQSFSGRQVTSCSHLDLLSSERLEKIGKRDGWATRPPAIVFWILCGLTVFLLILSVLKSQSMETWRDKNFLTTDLRFDSLKMQMEGEDGIAQMKEIARFTKKICSDGFSQGVRDYFSRASVENWLTYQARLSRDDFRIALVVDGDTIPWVSGDRLADMRSDIMPVFEKFFLKSGFFQRLGIMFVMTNSYIRSIWQIHLSVPCILELCSLTAAWPSALMFSALYLQATGEVVAFDCDSEQSEQLDAGGKIRCMFLGWLICVLATLPLLAFSFMSKRSFTYKDGWTKSDEDAWILKRRCVDFLLYFILFCYIGLCILIVMSFLANESEADEEKFFFFVGLWAVWHFIGCPLLLSCLQAIMAPIVFKKDNDFVEHVLSSLGLDHLLFQCDVEMKEAQVPQQNAASPAGSARQEPRPPYAVLQAATHNAQPSDPALRDIGRANQPNFREGTGLSDPPVAPQGMCNYCTPFDSCSGSPNPAPDVQVNREFPPAPVTAPRPSAFTAPPEDDRALLDVPLQPDVLDVMFNDSALDNACEAALPITRRSIGGRK